MPFRIDRMTDRSREKAGAFVCDYLEDSGDE